MNDKLLEELAERVMSELQKRWAAQSAQSSPQSGGLAGAGGGAKAHAAPADGLAGGQTGGHGGSDAASRARIPSPKSKEGLIELLESTPARIGVWRAGSRPLTSEMLKFRSDHAAAVDTVYGTVSERLIHEFGFVIADTKYVNIENYLKRPDMGRVLTEESVARIKEQCVKKPQVQIVVSSGLSASAIEANLRDIYPALLDSLKANGLTPGTPIYVNGGRVKVMDQIGELLQPETLVLLIGERPGLVSASSMSAYMCYRPNKDTVESDRNVISNIHRGGTPPVEAGAHIGTMLRKMIEQKTSGVKLAV